MIDIQYKKKKPFKTINEKWVTETTDELTHKYWGHCYVSSHQDGGLGFVQRVKILDHCSVIMTSILVLDAKGTIALPL